MNRLIAVLFLLACAVEASFGIDGVPGPPGPGTATPEPSSLVLVGVGLLAGGYAIYRGRRRKS